MKVTNNLEGQKLDPEKNPISKKIN
jgi:hypothetical protein